MNKVESNNNDLLRQFMNSELAGKAPSGFTSKVMSRVQLEPKSVHAGSKQRRPSFVPSVSLGVLLILILASVFLAPADNSSLLPLSDLLKSLQITIPVPDFSDMKLITVPGWVPYGIAGLFLLTLFDRALYGIFKRMEK